VTFFRVQRVFYECKGSFDRCSVHFMDVDGLLADVDGPLAGVDGLLVDADRVLADGYGDLRAVDNPFAGGEGKGRSTFRYMVTTAECLPTVK
jgi:hypothetical protein